LNSIIDTSWDFVNSNTKELTHCYHNYPAMMIPQIARRLIHEYKQKSTNLLLDPYCGSGTSLVESNMQGINAIGFDINPLAILLSKSKTTKFSIELIKQGIQIFYDELDNHLFAMNSQFGLFNMHQENGYKTQIKNNNQTFKNIDFWYKPEIIGNLSKIKHFIKNKIHPDVQLFFLTAFSETSREVSLTRNSEFKLFRMKQIKIDDFNPDSFSIFLQKLNRNLIGLESYTNKIENNAESKVFMFNTCYQSPLELIDDKIDLIVTSPPYGDSRTTVAYGQFSRLSNQWLDFPDAEKVDNSLMGGKTNRYMNGFEVTSAKKEFELIKEIDSKRFDEVNSFTFDYYNSIKNISEVVNKNAFVCYVLGNRTVKGVQIPLDKITVEFFESFGYHHINTFVRRIPNKRMPSRNSPTNETGITGSTMSNEYIVVMKKM